MADRGILPEWNSDTIQTIDDVVDYHKKVFPGLTPQMLQAFRRAYEIRFQKQKE